MTSTRPDLAYTLSALSQRMKAPKEADLQAAKRVLRYIKKTRDLALTYTPTDDPLTGYTDSDWAGDVTDRKSTSGYVFNLHGAAISWKSKKQTFVALSSTEAEYIGCSEAAREAVWIRRLYEDLTSRERIPEEQIHPQLIYADNQGAIKISENSKICDRTKHIEIKYHFVRDARERRQIELQYLPTAEMTADILTKPLPRDTHQRHVSGMGLRPDGEIRTSGRS